MCTMFDIDILKTAFSDTDTNNPIYKKETITSIWMKKKEVQLEHNLARHSF